jgi:hypothetical protein
LTKDSPLTVAGAAAALDENSSAPRSLLIPYRGTVARRLCGESRLVSNLRLQACFLAIKNFAAYPRIARIGCAMADGDRFYALLS